MSRLHFSDFEDYCATIADADLRMRVLGMEQPRYSISHASVGRYQIQHANEGSGQLSEGVTEQGGVGLYVQLNQRPLTVNGTTIDPNAVAVLPPGSEFCFSCEHANSWFSIVLPLDVLGADASPSRSAPENQRSVSVVRPAPQITRRLRRIVPRYLSALEHSPALRSSSTATAEFEETMSVIARDVLQDRTAASTSASQDRVQPRTRLQRIASEAAGIIEATLDQGQSIEGIARRLDISERTLLTAFRTRFGVSPRRFIHSMRLNKARQLLRNADPAGVRVADIAAECGYWDFGRFASRYQTLFGELPSETLQR